MKPRIDLSERSFRTDLNELSGEIVHELYVLCRKAAIYLKDHPMVRKSISRPFLDLQKIFGFKKYFSLILTEGKLFANNILMADSSNMDYLKECMQQLDIKSILFDMSLTADDLLTFVDYFARRLPGNHPDYPLEKLLENHNINSILVNHKLSVKIFETGRRYRGNAKDDYSVRRMVADYFSGEIDLAIKILSANYTDTGAQVAATGIDFHTDIVNYILPEKFAQLQPAELMEVAEKMFDADTEEVDSAAGKLARLVRSFDYHPKRDMLLEKIKAKFESLGLKGPSMRDSLSDSGKLKLEMVQAIDRIRNNIFSEKEFDPELYARFHDAFMRLVRTRQTGKAAGVTEDLIEYLASDNNAFRRHAVYLLGNVINSIISFGDYDFFDMVIRKLQYLFTQGRETFEFSETVSELLGSMLSLRRYEPVAAFLNVLKSGRKVKAGVTIYDSIVVKKIFDDLDDHELIARMVQELQVREGDQMRFIRDILIAIQSEGVALQLSAIVAHPDRMIRQRCLKVLSELGKPAMAISSEILRDESNFYRAEGCHELPDKKWFLVRNAIFVLGNLGDPEACHALRMRLSDPDTRVRREIVRALEKIQGDDAVDLLMILAEDTDISVREMAIITLGLLKRRDLALFFIDLLSRIKTEVSRIINAIAQTGSGEARDFLVNLLENQEKLKSLSSGKASVDDIREMIIKGLEKLGDEKSLRKAEEYLTREQGEKLFSRNSGLGKTAKLILDKIQPKK